MIDLNVALYTFLDIEASGLDQPNSYPIEIAWSDTLGNQDAFLIQPASCWVHWDERAEAVHGISREILLGNGIPVREAAERLNESLGVETIYCDAIDFDGFWMSRLFAAAGQEMTFFLASVFDLYAELTSDQLTTLLAHLRENPSTHRALADAYRYSGAFLKALR